MKFSIIYKVLKWSYWLGLSILLTAVTHPSPSFGAALSCEVVHLKSHKGFLAGYYAKYRSSKTEIQEGQIEINDKGYSVLGNLDPNKVGIEAKIWLIKSGNQHQVVKDFNPQNPKDRTEAALENLGPVVDGHFKIMKFLESKGWGPKVYEQGNLMLRMEFITGFTMSELEAIARSGISEFDMVKFLEIKIKSDNFIKLVTQEIQKKKATGKLPSDEQLFITYPHIHSDNIMYNPFNNRFYVIDPG